MLKQDYYNEFFELGQQKINFSFFELCLPDDDPVYTLKKVMEKLDFSGLPACNTIIEIDHCSPLEIVKLQKSIMRIASGEGIGFVHGKGKRKPEIQQLYEEVEECGRRLMEYKECFEIMGKDRNSYSKTDLEATFMRMKEDHMLNGQLKPAYNTLIPVLKKHQRAFGDTLEAVTADSGYCSEKNLMYLKGEGIQSYIKLQDHEKRKTRAYKEDIGKYYNMTYAIFEDEHHYICHDGRQLRHIRTENREQRTGRIYPDV